MDEKEQKGLFQRPPFYNFLIEKPHIEYLKNIDWLHDLPFYGELNIEKKSIAFKEYAKGCKIEIKDLKDPLAPLEACKSRIKDFLKDLLDEIKDFKYQITVKVLLSKLKGNEDIEFALVYSNSTTKTVIHFK